MRTPKLLLLVALGLILSTCDIIEQFSMELDCDPVAFFEVQSDGTELLQYTYFYDSNRRLARRELYNGLDGRRQSVVNYNYLDDFSSKLSGYEFEVFNTTGDNSVIHRYEYKYSASGDNLEVEYYRNDERTPRIINSYYFDDMNRDCGYNRLVTTIVSNGNTITAEYTFNEANCDYTVYYPNSGRTYTYTYTDQLDPHFNLYIYPNNLFRRYLVDRVEERNAEGILTKITGYQYEFDEHNHLTRVLEYDGPALRTFLFKYECE